MGKKPSKSSSPKIPKHQNKPQIHNLNKIIPPKVFIIESSNFKNLVQQLTGNGNSPVPSPAPPSVSSPPTRPPFLHDQENSLETMSFDSSCFSTPLESSPNYQDFSSEYLDLESLLMGMDSASNNYYESCYGVNKIDQQEVCVYDYDISSFM